MKFPFFWVNNGLDFFLFTVLFLDLVLNPNQKLIWIETRSHTHNETNKQTKIAATITITTTTTLIASKQNGEKNLYLI